jgi:hypothetical protein
LAQGNELVFANEKVTNEGLQEPRSVFEFSGNGLRPQNGGGVRGAAARMRNPE